MTTLGGADSAPSVMIVAGEPSGDRHAAQLIGAMRRRAPGLQARGMGLKALRGQGVDLLVDASGLAVVGFVEVLVHLRALYRAFHVLRRELTARPPDLLIVVDYPGFNMRLAKVAHGLNIPVMYYITPQVWAWRPQRVKRLRDHVDLMAVVFPFEVAFYERHGIPVRFVGHPLVDEVQPTLSVEAARRSLELDMSGTGTVIGLFPGSRKAELGRLMPVYAQLVEHLRAADPRLQFLIPLAEGLQEELVYAHIPRGHPYVTVVQGRFYDVIQACDVIVTASGTASLEISLLGVPHVITYRVAPLTYAIARRVIRVDSIGIVNIIGERRIVPEFVQHAAEPAGISAAVLELLYEPERAERMRRDFAEVRARLGGGGAAEAAADAALTTLHQRRAARTV